MSNRPRPRKRTPVAKSTAKPATDTTAKPATETTAKPATEARAKPAPDAAVATSSRPATRPQARPPAAVASPPNPGSDESAPAWLPLVLRIGGLVVGLMAGVLLALYGSFLTPFRINGVLVPISLLLAVGGNLALIWFTYTTTQHKGMALAPSLVWVVLAFVASRRTTEGDLVLIDSNWVSVSYLLVGSITIGIAAYRMILHPRR